MRRAVTACIRAYQIFLSPLRILLPLGGVNGCRFHPSCSEYTAEAVMAHGVRRGCVLGAKRLLRCHPWNHGGFDPVPPAGAHGKTGCCAADRGGM
jgi:uncharacterized protein